MYPPPPPPHTHTYKYTGTMFNHFLCTVGADGIMISPSTDYTTFENNPPTFTFNCSGNGTVLYWIVDGYTTGTLYVLNKGIKDTNFLVSPDGLTVSSQLIVPTTKANNNTVVVCTQLDLLFNRQSSDPVKLILQGTVHCCI